MYRFSSRGPCVSASYWRWRRGFLFSTPRCFTWLRRKKLNITYEDSQICLVFPIPVFFFLNLSHIFLCFFPNIFILSFYISYQTLCIIYEVLPIARRFILIIYRLQFSIGLLRGFLSLDLFFSLFFFFFHACIFWH